MLKLITLLELQLLNRKEENMANYYSDEQIELAQSKNIFDVAHALGYEYHPVGQQGNVRISNIDSMQHLELRPASNTFAWYNQDKKGNVIQFYRDVTGSTFPEAMEYLLGNEFSISTYVPVEKLPYENDFNFSPSYLKAYNYLVNVRKLDFEIIDLLCKKQYIREETQYNNVVFQWVKYGCVVGSNLKSTNPDSSFKRISTNSESNFGFNITIGNLNEIRDIYFFEAACDLLAFLSDKKNTLQNAMLVDLEGVKKESFLNFQQYATSLEIKLPDPSHLHICVDRDEVGQNFFNSVNIYADEITGESLISDDRIPVESGAKDWNEYVQMNYQPDYILLTKIDNQAETARIKKRTNGSYLLETYRANNLFQLIDCNDREQLMKAVEDYDMTRIPHNDLKKFNLLSDKMATNLSKREVELEAGD